MFVPSHLNGHSVIAFIESTDNRVFVMVKRRDPYAPFVVAEWYPELKETWIQGDYCRTRQEANEIWLERAKLNQGLSYSE